MLHVSSANPLAISSGNAEEEASDRGTCNKNTADGSEKKNTRVVAKKDTTFYLVIGLFLAYGYYNTLRGSFPIQMRRIATDLNIPVAKIGLPTSVFSAFYGIGKFYGSILTDYLPCAECHTLGVLLCGLNLSAIGLCNGISSISAMWGIQGLLQALGWPFLSRIVIDKLPQEERAKYWGVLSMAGNVGSMVAPYSAVLASAMGLSWRGALRLMGASSALITLLVHALLKRGGAQRGPRVKAVEDSNAKKNPSGKEQPKGSWLSALKNPVLLLLMLCNSLSFGASKCTKEWGAMYLRGTHLATTDMQSANLLFWAEVGGSIGAALSGVVSVCLGGRHALTCLLSGGLGALSTGALAIKSYTWKGDGHGPMPFGLACLLQACSLAGINGVRTLAGLHMAEVAAYYKIPLGLASGFGELIGQVGSVLSGLPIGAIVSRATARARARGKTAEEATRIGWAVVLAVLTLASAGMASFNLALLPAETKRLRAQAASSSKTEQLVEKVQSETEVPDDAVQGA